MITVPTTASRFALLQIDSDSDSEVSESGKSNTKNLRESSGKPRQGKAGGAGKTAQGSDKKKDKKKKRKEQQQSEANEVNNWKSDKPFRLGLSFYIMIDCVRDLVMWHKPFHFLFTRNESIDAGAQRKKGADINCMFTKNKRLNANVLLLNRLK